MQVEKSMPWHGGKTACTNTYRCGVCAAGQASSLPGSRRISASRALHVRARSMPCCVGIAHGMKNAARMLSMHRGVRRCSQPRVVDSPRLCLRTFVQTLTEPVSGTFPLPRAGYIRDSRSRLFQNQYTQPFPSGPSVCCYPVQFTVCETVTLNSIDVQGEQQ